MEVVTDYEQLTVVGAHQQYSSVATMSSEESEKQRSNYACQTIGEHITTVVHTFIVCFVILIVYLCSTSDWQYFTWHPFLMSIGVRMTKKHRENLT